MTVKKSWYFRIQKYKSSNKLKCDKYPKWVERKREKCVVSHRRYSFLWVTLRNGYFPHTGREKDEKRGGSYNFVDSTICKNSFRTLFHQFTSGSKYEKIYLRHSVHISTEPPPPPPSFSFPAKINSSGEAGRARREPIQRWWWRNRCVVCKEFRSLPWFTLWVNRLNDQMIIM